MFYILKKLYFEFYMEQRISQSVVQILSRQIGRPGITNKFFSIVNDFMKIIYIYNVSNVLFMCLI